MFSPGLWIRIRIGSGFSDFVDPDPYWESGSRRKKIKKFQWKNALFSYLKKIVPLKKVPITTFWKKFWWITPVFFIWFDSNLDFKQIWERNCLEKFCFSLDPDPDWAKMLDPYWVNPDPQPWFSQSYSIITPEVYLRYCALFSNIFNCLRIWSIRRDQTSGTGIEHV
jgi:hypothetical protein